MPLNAGVAGRPDSESYDLLLDLLLNMLASLPHDTHFHRSDFSAAINSKTSGSAGLKWLLTEVRYHSGLFETKNQQAADLSTNAARDEINSIMNEWKFVEDFLLQQDAGGTHGSTFELCMFNFTD